MATLPALARQVTAVPAVTPFVAPEELARRAGRSTLLRLGANESVFGPSPHALAALVCGASEAWMYGDPESTELRAELAQRYNCTLENIVIGSGIDDLIALIIRAFCAPGATTLSTRGTYPTWRYHTIAFGAVAASAPPNAVGGVDIDALLEQAGQLRPQIVYVANPDNPSGAFTKAAELARLRAGLHDDVLLVVDEAYADFVEPKDLPALDLDPRTIRLRTFSKAHGLAGARIGYAIADASYVASFQKIRQHFGVNRMAQLGALASLRDTAFVAGVVSQVTQGRARYVELGRQLGCRTLSETTNFVNFEIGTRAQAEAIVGLLLDGGVFVRKPYAAPLDGFIRVTIGDAAAYAEFARVFRQAREIVREQTTV